MAKRSDVNVSSIVVTEVTYPVTDSIALSDIVSYTIEEQSVKVVNKFPASISIRGQITGKLYEWGGAGVVVEVAKEDVPQLLTKKIGDASCCGNNQKGNLLFEVVI